jgi:hypothetical protein
VPDNSDSTQKRSTRNRRGRRQSLAPREAVLGLDPLERGISIFGASIAFVLAIVTAIEWKRNLPTITTTKYKPGKACPSAFPTHVNTLCEHIVKTTRTEWEVKFFFIFLVAACILYFALRRKRAGVATFAVFLGLGLGLGSGLVFFFMGAWLIMRAYRLQKYGVATMTGSNRVAREMARARKEGREPDIETYTGSTGTSGSAAPRTSSSKKTTPKSTTPEASKRYTPKKPAPKRR